MDQQYRLAGIPIRVMEGDTIARPDELHGLGSARGLPAPAPSVRDHRAAGAGGTARGLRVCRVAPGPGRAARALLATCLSSTDQWTDAMRRSSVVLVAALVHNSKHVEPLRKANREMHQRFGGDGLPPGVGDLIHLVVHGMWFDWIFGLSDWSPQRLAAVRQAIQRVLDGHLPRASSAGSRKPAVKRGGKVAPMVKKQVKKKVGKRPSTRQRTRGTRS